MATVKRLLELFERTKFSLEEISVVETLLGETLKECTVERVKEKLKRYIDDLLTENEVSNEVGETQKELSLATVVHLRSSEADLLAESLTERCTVYKSMVDNSKTQLIFNLLKPNQRLVFEQLHQYISSSLSEVSPFDGEIVTEPTSVCIDSPPGTGKSFLISSLAATLVFTPTVMVYQRSLVSKLRMYPNLDAMTCCKYVMQITHTEYDQAIRIFDDARTIDLMLVGVYKMIYKFHQRCILVVLDEYTVVSPWFLVVLLVAAAVNRFNVICTGDKDQHNAIQKSRFHNQTNHTVVEHLVEHKLKLDRQMRISDHEYNSLIVDYKEKMMNVDNSLDSVPNTFANLYFLFGKLMQKFFVKEQLLDVVYMSQFHKKIKLRQQSLINHLDRKRLPYSLALFKQGPQLPDLVDLHVPDEHLKFLPYLLLIVGQKYVWTTDDDRYVVTLVHVNEDNLVVSTGENHHTILRRRLVPWWHNIPDEHFDWLKTYADKSLWQYPLRYYYTTYHAAQGLTMSDEIIELDIDTSTANSIYVGLSRVTKESQIYALRTKHLASLMYTLYKNDDYYYKLSNAPSKLYKKLLRFVCQREMFLDGTVFRECAKNDFERYNRRNMKVLKSEYVESTNRPKSVTELISVAKFFLEDKDALFKVEQIEDNKLVAMYKRYIVRNELIIEPSSSLKRGGAPPSRNIRAKRVKKQS